MSQANFEKLVNMFNLMDRSGDGYIDQRELLQFFYDVGDVDSIKRATSMLEKADIDNSHSIDFSEFCHYMVSLKNEHIDEFHDLIEAFGSSNNDVSKWMIAPLKLLSFVMPDILLSAVFLSWLNTLCSTLSQTTESSPVRFTAKHIMMSPFAVGSKAEREEWKKHQSECLPNYYVASCLIYNEMYDYIYGLCPAESALIKAAISGTSIFLTVTGISHVVTPRGRLVWFTVIKKYLTFILACTGVWTEDVMNCYELEKILKFNSDRRDKSRKPEKQSSSDQDKNHVDMCDLISLTVGPRAILLQIIPFGAFLSLYSLGCSSTPLVLLSEKASDYFPSLFIADAT